MSSDETEQKGQQQTPQLVKRQRTLAPDTSPTAGQQVQHRLLLIEDHVGLAEATAEFIRWQGLEVRVALCGRDALEAVPTFQPEIVLCDLRLPDMTGLEVVRALRSSPDAKSAVIAICTAMTDIDLIELEHHEYASDVNQFLSKPITPEKLDTLLSALHALRQAA